MQSLAAAATTTAVQAVRLRRAVAPYFAQSVSFVNQRHVDWSDTTCPAPAAAVWWMRRRLTGSTSCKQPWRPCGVLQMPCREGWLTTASSMAQWSPRCRRRSKLVAAAAMHTGIPERLGFCQACWKVVLKPPCRAAPCVSLSMLEQLRPQGGFHGVPVLAAGHGPKQVHHSHQGGCHIHSDCSRQYHCEGGCRKNLHAWVGLLSCRQDHHPNKDLNLLLWPARVRAAVT